MPKQQAKELYDLRIDRVSFVTAGDDPNAHVCLIKAKRGKCECDESLPLSFDEQAEAKRAREVAWALDDRIMLLSDVIYWIMTSDVTDKETRVLESLRQFNDTMESDVPELMDGTLAKELLTADVSTREVLAKSLHEKLSNEGRGARSMAEFDASKLPEDARKEFEQREKDRAEAVAKVATLEEQIAGLSTKIDELTKAKSEPGEDDVLKGLSPKARERLDKAEASAKDSAEKVDKLTKAARTEKLKARMATLPTLGLTEKDHLPQLEKAADVGDEVVDAIFGAWEVAEKALIRSGILKSVGSEAEAAGSAHAEAVGKAKALQANDSSLTIEAAMGKVYEGDQDLYARVNDEDIAAAAG